MRRQLPLIRPSSSEPSARADEAQPIALDTRWLVVCCEAGLDVAAAWVDGLLGGLAAEGVSSELVYSARVPPIGAQARSVLARGQPYAIAAPTSPVCVWVSDVLQSVAGARASIVLAERIPTPRPGAFTPGVTFVRPDRVSTARALAVRVARSAM